MTEHQPPQAPARARWRTFAVIALVSYLLDLASKQWALSALEPGEYHPLVGGVFGLELVFNPGAAFSLLTGATWVFTVLSLVVIAVVVRMALKVTSTWWAITLGMLLGGALGNLTDRLVREPGVGMGHVVDFLNYNGYFVGNVADIFIVLAAVGIAGAAFRGIPATASTQEPNDEESNDG